MKLGLQASVSVHAVFNTLYLRSIMETDFYPRWYKSRMMPSTNRLDFTLPGISGSLIVPLSMEGVQSRRGHMGLRSRHVTCARDLAI